MLVPGANFHGEQGVIWPAGVQMNLDEALEPPTDEGNRGAFRSTAKSTLRASPDGGASSFIAIRRARLSSLIPAVLTTAPNATGPMSRGPGLYVSPLPAQRHAPRAALL